jgi:hypothetical protein
MNRRNFIKISALSSVALALVPQTLISGENVNFNAFIKGQTISFKENEGIRVSDCILITNGEIEAKAIVTNRLEENKFNFVFMDRNNIIEGDIIAISVMRNYY